MSYPVARQSCLFIHIALYDTQLLPMMGSTLALAVINGASSRVVAGPDNDDTGTYSHGTHCAGWGLTNQKAANADNDDVNRLTYFANRLDSHSPFELYVGGGIRLTKSFREGVRLGLSTPSELSHTPTRDDESKVPANSQGDYKCQKFRRKLELMRIQ